MELRSSRAAIHEAVEAGIRRDKVQDVAWRAHQRKQKPNASSGFERRVYVEPFMLLAWNSTQVTHQPFPSTLSGTNLCPFSQNKSVVSISILTC